MYGIPSYPTIRPRRLRQSENIRRLVSDTFIRPSDLVLPIFINETISRPKPIESLPDHYYYPPKSPKLVETINEASEIGVRSFLLFGVPSIKDNKGSRAYAADGPVQEAVRYIRREIGWSPLIITDLCLCGYTDHGHCGAPKRCRRGICIDNDSTLSLYKKIAVSQADAGADIVAPSGMMDGQVSAIRNALDSEGFSDVGIMSYSVKFASSFYGPFRDVMGSAPKWGDRSTYQLDPSNSKDIIKEAILDIMEGADIIMVKPALPYLDAIVRVSETIPTHPIAAYNVSGEYNMIRLLAKNGFGDYKKLVVEVLTSIKRAGADMIITYHALEAVKFLKEVEK